MSSSSIPLAFALPARPRGPRAGRVKGLWLWPRRWPSVAGCHRRLHGLSPCAPLQFAAGSDGHRRGAEASPYLYCYGSSRGLASFSPYPAFAYKGWGDVHGRRRRLLRHAGPLAGPRLPMPSSGRPFILAQALAFAFDRALRPGYSRGSSGRWAARAPQIAGK